MSLHLCRSKHHWNSGIYFHVSLGLQRRGRARHGKSTQRKTKSHTHTKLQTFSADLDCKVISIWIVTILSKNYGEDQFLKKIIHSITITMRTQTEMLLILTSLEEPSRDLMDESKANEWGSGWFHLRHWNNIKYPWRRMLFKGHTKSIPFTSVNLHSESSLPWYGAMLHYTPPIKANLEESNLQVVVFFNEPCMCQSKMWGRKYLFALCNCYLWHVCLGLIQMRQEIFLMATSWGLL